MTALRSRRVALVLILATFGMVGIGTSAVTASTREPSASPTGASGPSGAPTSVPSPTPPGPSGAPTNLPPGAVQIAPGVISESVNQPSDWWESCQGVGYACFYSSAVGQAVSFWQTDDPPADYYASEAPYTAFDNFTGYRVWLHEYLDWEGGNGWAYCIDPYAGPASVPSAYQSAGDVYISNNTSAC